MKKQTFVFQVILRVITIWCFTFIISSCNRPSEGSKKAGKHIENIVSAVIETTPVPQKKNEDSADDPAIWINSDNLSESIIFGTDKKGGLAAYKLDGTELSYYHVGNMNNCDIRYNFEHENSSSDILAASNRSHHSLSLYRIRPQGKLDSLHNRIIKSEMTDEVYGLCMYKSSETGRFYVFMNSKAGEVEQWELINKNHKIDGKLVRSFNLGTQTEGMVADDETGIIYIGCEIKGIYKFDAEPERSIEGTYIENSSEENPNIKYDVEGLAIYDSGNGEGYLIASSQGNYSYAVFERRGNNKYLGSFRIVDGKEIDGVEETDGLDVTTIPLGPEFSSGMLVVQDGFNYDGRKKKSQNFKLVSWEEVEKYLN